MILQRLGRCSGATELFFGRLWKCLNAQTSSRLEVKPWQQPAPSPCPHRRIESAKSCCGWLVWESTISLSCLYSWRATKRPRDGYGTSKRSSKIERYRHTPRCTCQTLGSAATRSAMSSHLSEGGCLRRACLCVTCRFGDVGLPRSRHRDGGERKASLLRMSIMQPSKDADVLRRANGNVNGRAQNLAAPGRFRAYGLGSFYRLLTLKR